MVIYTPSTVTLPQFYPRHPCIQICPSSAILRTPAMLLRGVHEARAIALPPPSFYLKKSMAASENNPNIGLLNGFFLASGAHIGAQIGLKYKLVVACRPWLIFPPPPSRTIVHTFVQNFYKLSQLIDK